MYHSLMSWIWSALQTINLCTPFSGYYFCLAKPTAEDVSCNYAINSSFLRNLWSINARNGQHVLSVPEFGDFWIPAMCFWLESQENCHLSSWCHGREPWNHVIWADVEMAHQAICSAWTMMVPTHVPSEGPSCLSLALGLIFTHLVFKYSPSPLCGGFEYSGKTT